MSIEHTPKVVLINQANWHIEELKNIYAQLLKDNPYLDGYTGSTLQELYKIVDILGVK